MKRAADGCGAPDVPVSYLDRGKLGCARIGLVEGYGFDPSWSDERRRLALIERCYDPMTISRLTELGVVAGWRCLDVGAGRGSVARWLRDRVGPDGRVVAVDLDTRFFENEPGIEASQRDILADEIEQDAFDLVHCRLLLHHLRGRQLEAVTRMASALRPGGVLIASECYLGAMRASGPAVGSRFPTRFPREAGKPSAVATCSSHHESGSLE
jgi:SAM-dependent methyltransferase